MVFNSTTEKKSSKEVSMKSTGHDKARVSICLTGQSRWNQIKTLHRI